MRAYRLGSLVSILIIMLSGAAGATGLQDLSRELVTLVKNASPAIVELRVQRPLATAAAILKGDDGGIVLRSEMGAAPNRAAAMRMQSVGSGFVFEPSGYILTTASVVAGAQEVAVRFPDGSEADGEVMGSDPVVDVAVVKVSKVGLKAIPLGDSDQLEPGALVVTINSQAGLQNSASLGMVAGTGRKIGVSDGIQISGTVGPGASGGPVLDASGKVVGVTAAMLSPTSVALPFNWPEVLVPWWYGAPSDDAGKAMPQGAYRTPDGKPFTAPDLKSLKEMGQALMGAARATTQTSGSAGFAIPINRVKSILDELKAGKPVQRAWLGAQVVEKGGGIVFTEMVLGSPAEKAGVKAEDRLVSADGRKFSKVKDLTGWIADQKPGKTVRLVVSRDGKQVDLDVKLAAQPGFPGAPGAELRPKVWAGGWTPPFAISLDDADIAQVAKALSSTSGKNVVVSEPEKIKKHVTLHLNSTSIEKALDVICRTMDCKYAKDGDTYVITPK